ncbi:MAG TPA: ATP-binding cassette domain-containing protein, partial [Anaerolineae bacterium]
MQADSTTPAVSLRSVYKRFRTPDGRSFTALADLNLTVRDGEFLAIVGPTGSGKSTTLTLVSGLEPPSAGEVQVYGEPLRELNPHAGYMFQADALFPWKSVLENVAAGPLFRGVPRATAVAQSRDWIQRVGLAGFEG